METELEYLCSPAKMWMKNKRNAQLKIQKEKYNVGLMDLKKNLLIKNPAKVLKVHSWLIFFFQGNDLKAFEKNENITRFSTWYKFNTANVLFPVTGFIKGANQTCSLNFSV